MPSTGKTLGGIAFSLLLLVTGRLLLTATAQTAQTNEAKRGAVEMIKVHGKSLEGNLDGDSPDRDVSIYLPYSYKSEKNRRYPVIYMLHGFTDDNAKWFGAVKHWINLPEVLDKTFAGGETREMIVVMPNAFTRFKGSMYSNSVTVGDWETFVTRELVAQIDSQYRTIPQAASRGLAGHSMGGYGALRLSMKSEGVFSSIYALSPCCMDTGLGNPPNEAMKEMLKKLEAVRTDEEVKAQSFLGLAIFASAAAWTPNPKNPPFFIDLPFRGGEIQPEILARQQANATLVMIHQYIPALKRLKAIGFDAGTKDAGIYPATQRLDKVMTEYSIAHFYETYDGDHLNRIAERIQTKTMPFFSNNLSFEQGKDNQRAKR
ncbi:MAG: esterase [Blastocatellia bacterium]|nr:esterase [Blastocatellia bacterium]